MPRTATPSNRAPRASRTTKTTPAPEVIVDPLAPLEGENTDEYVIRMHLLGTLPASSAAAAAIELSDATWAEAAFGETVRRAKRVGDAAIHHATIVKAVRPESFADVSKALLMTADNGVKFAGKAYSTLRESYRLSVAYGKDGSDGAAQIASFVDVWTKVEGSAPRNVRDALAWLERVGTDDQWTENTEESYQEAKDARVAAAAAAAATKQTGNKRTEALVNMGYVPGLEDVLTKARIAVMPIDQMDDLVKLFTVKLLKARKAAEKEAAKALAEAANREAGVNVGTETGAVHELAS